MNLSGLQSFLSLNMRDEEEDRLFTTPPIYFALEEDIKYLDSDPARLELSGLMI